MGCWWGGNVGNFGSGTLGGWGIAGFIMNLLLFLLILVGVALLLAWLVRSYQKPAGVGPSSSKGIEILKERYARGQISKAEFDKIRKELG